ncbi:Pleiotropic drug resistance protein abc superfamily, partial [Globisporangium splendens]
MEGGDQKEKDGELLEQVAATDIVVNAKGDGFDLPQGLIGTAASPATETLPRIRLDSSQAAAKEVVDIIADLSTTSDRIATCAKSTLVERYSSLDASNVESLISGGFNRYLGKYKSVRREHNLTFPTPEIHFENLSYTVWLSSESPTAKSSIGGYFKSIVAPRRKLRTVKKVILHPMSGVIRPGSMTLILANPGARKSTFLKALAGKLTSRNGRRSLKGNISYSGLAAEEITISKLVGLVDQLDNHFATLTVRETIQFADRCLNGAPERQPEKLREVARLRTDVILHILGLTKCADTCVGDALLRGVSGGERKRVTIGEMLVGGQSVFLCDEMPPPEVVELFDDVLILSEGRLVFHGPRVEMLPYFNKLGFECPEHVDPAEFAVEVASGLGGRFLKTHGIQAGFKPPRQAIQFEDAFATSPVYRQTVPLIEEKRRNKLKSGNEDKLHSIEHLIRKNSGTPLYKSGFIETTSLLLERQKKIWLRDRALVLGNLTEAILIGLLLGIIYLNVKSKIYLRMLFFVIAIFQRQAWQQITIAFQVRRIFYKRRSRNFFRTLSYTIAESLAQVPLNVAVSFTLVVIYYFMSGLSTGRTIHRTHHDSCPSDGESLFELLLLFSGNIILPQLIPDYWIWMFWFNPLAWTLRAMLLNEFHDHRYSAVDREAALARVQVTHGEEFIWIGILVLIAYYIIFTLLNTAVLRFIHYEFQSTASSTENATEDSYSVDDKTRRGNSSRDLSVVTPQQTPSPENADNKDTVIQVPAAAGSGESSSNTFISAYLAVKRLSYFVPNPTGQGELQLLHDVTAYFVPGKMTALMGSSGAGKTTFMDVLAGRKTGGRFEGQILVNGEPKDPLTFSRIAGYCEQMDIHSGGATIREALVFSARLRLPPDTTDKGMEEIVQNTMDLLELNGIASELVRNCSVEQKKRITIGVEVVSNPSILFLDEPTSGLDARSASIVMKGVLSIALTGRTVVCTIHQPSKQIFELFDSLLLLQKGGYMAYFGELGESSKKLLQYLTDIPGTAPIQPKYNPATYMLEVIGAGIGRGESRDYSVEHSNSALCKYNQEFTEALGTGKFVANADEVARSGAEPELVVMTPFSSLKLSPIATGFFVQLRCCVKKMTMTYWRNPQYNLVRTVALPIYASIFGSAFYKLTEGTSAAVTSHVARMYNTLDFIGVINLMTVLDTVSSERAVFYRERMSNYYGPLPYSLSLFVAEFPYLALTSFLFMNVEYWMIRWEESASSFFLFWFVFYLHISNCTSVGQFMVVLMPNVKVANVAVGALSVFFNLFSGFLMPHIQMRGFYRWIRYLVITNCSLESLVSIEMGQCDSPTAHGCTTVRVPKAGATPAYQIQLKQFIHANYGFEYSYIWRNIGILIGILAFLQVAIYLTLRFVSHLKR